jgi:hypothetical protein
MYGDIIRAQVVLKGGEADGVIDRRRKEKGHKHSRHGSTTPIKT